MNLRTRMFFLSMLDASIVATAVVIVYLLRFDFTIPPKEVRLLPYVILTHAVFYLIFFHWMKLYHRMLQYASIGEVKAILKATSLAEICCFVFHKTFPLVVPGTEIPRSIYVSWALIVLGVGGSRLAWRMFRDTVLNSKIGTLQRKALIIGAGGTGVLVAKTLKNSKDSNLYPIAFIDDDRTRHDLKIMGLPVIGGRERIPEVIDRYKIQDIVIAIPSAPKSEIAKIIDICRDTKTSIKILPSVADLINGRVSIKSIREVRVEDLLGRDPVEINLDEIAGYVTDQVVLVTGAGGSIGSELCRQISSYEPKKLLLLGRGENSLYEIELELRNSYPKMLETLIADIQDRQRIREVFEHYRPSVVFHAAAHKHVPLMEQNPAEAVKNNIFGTKNVAEGANEYGSSHFIMISSDKAVNPTSVMGATKRVAEIFIQGIDRRSSTKFVAVRFGNVLGSRGSVIPVFQKQIQAGGPVTVTHPDMIRYFMTIPEAVQLVIQAGALAKGGEIFILDMGEPVRIVDLARNLIRLSGLLPDKDIKIEYTNIRPGEKLFEEILTNEEGLSATKHDRIFVGKPMNVSWDELQVKLQELQQILTKDEASHRSEEIKKLLRNIVPSYFPSQEVQE